MKRYLINYAANTHIESQKLNTHSGLQYGFDSVFQCSPSDLQPDFVEKNKAILSQKRGAGYWLWKPYICLQALQKMNKGDILFYCDSGACFMSDITPLLDVLHATELGFMAFNIDPKEGNTETLQTKRDVFVALKCDDRDDIKKTYPRNGAFIIAEKTNFSTMFFQHYLKYCEDEQLLTDLPSIVPNYPEFNQHRHDQSIFSVLSKLYGIKAFRDPSQWGNPFMKASDGYGQIINHHRSNQ